MESDTFTPATGVRLLLQTILCFATELPFWFPDHFRFVVWLFLVTTDEPVFQLVQSIYHSLSIPYPVLTTAPLSTAASAHAYQPQTIVRPVKSLPNSILKSVKTLPNPTVQPPDVIPPYIATPPGDNTSNFPGESGNKSFPGHKPKANTAWLTEEHHQDDSIPAAPKKSAGKRPAAADAPSKSTSKKPATAAKQDEAASSKTTNKEPVSADVTKQADVGSSKLANKEPAAGDAASSDVKA